MDPVGLGEAIRSRRLVLRWTQQQLAIAAGVSVATVRLLEQGRRVQYRDLTTSGVALALGWQADALDGLRRPESATPDSTPNQVSGSTRPAATLLAECRAALAGLDADQLRQVLDLVGHLQATSAPPGRG